MRSCLICDEPLIGPEVFRIRIGGVSYDEDENGTTLVQFVQQPGVDSFQDGTTIKWLCRSCAVERGILLRELDYGTCQIYHGKDCCGMGFEPLSEHSSDCVLEVERGTLHKNESGKGPSVVFITQDGGCVHFNCACDDPWRLPLCDLRSPDTP